MSRAAAPVACAFCVLACALLASCVAPGEPTSRHPVVPTAITDLAARQSGSTVLLTFTLPQKSMDRESLAEPPTIEIYRAALPPGAVPDRRTPWRLVYTIPSEQVDSYGEGGRIEFSDHLVPDDLTHPDGTLLAYLVRTRAVKARASGDSNVSSARVYPPPEAPQDLRVSVTESAIALSWRDHSDTGAPPKTQVYRVYREETEPPPPDAQPTAKLKELSPPELLDETTATEFRDERFEFGHTYVYFVRTVVQYGSDSVESDVPMGSSALITPRDIFPPAAPAGLEAAIVSATPQAPAYIELSWTISPEGDLAGYHVYRSDRDDTPGERINREILPSPTFRDISVASGRRYFYRVSAVDRAGNESPLSSTAQAEVP